MPTYEYECEKCRRVFEVRQRISEAPLTRCDACGGAVHRLLSPAPFILKGGGWYVTDYPSESRKKALESEKTSSKPADGKSPDGKAPEGKASDGKASVAKTAEGEAGGARKGGSDGAPSTTSASGSASATPPKSG